MKIKHFAAAGFEIDSVFDLARIFRVPGSFNHKDDKKKPVKVIRFEPEDRFSWDQIDQLGANNPRPSGTKRHDSEYQWQTLGNLV